MVEEIKEDLSATSSRSRSRVISSGSPDGSVPQRLKDIDEKIDQYMNEMDVRDKEEAKPGELGKEDLSKVLDYLERSKVQLTDALKKSRKAAGTRSALLIRNAG